jgi:hypothetical protein
MFGFPEHLFEPSKIREWAIDRSFPKTPVVVEMKHMELEAEPKKMKLTVIDFGDLSHDKNEREKAHQ